MGIGLCTQSEVKNAMLYGNLFAVFAVVGWNGERAERVFERGREVICNGWCPLVSYGDVS